ncbi:DNA-3-methyladenine glycosylase I [Aminivibrio sp.]|jgi:DNA-3-methyladenine glycosylase I|uniref:DNA-3-methyladenine glycosylase I n=1 Tax=Aminivibrio sp. TaxID=1872489 RepID=UPI001A487992|nr:DNA-3-methyladenine glycosylase I [Aminivibrio sp.]MBL3540099.1 DNA-3-methyladenine glycosylase I [Aminivibrio sp.]MDK2959654.1 DNA-3-methyladenine glycosylase [Synergistaceae bacterium]
MADGTLARCPWPGSDPLYVAYHDEEWGTPVRDDGKLFEFLLLEGAQAGLSWITILRRREEYRRAFDGFAPEKIARYDEGKIDALLKDSGIIRNRRKIEGAVKNARAYLRLREAKGSLSSFLWGFVDGEPVVNRWKSLEEIPAVTPLAENISKTMKREGFVFFGPVIAYAYMQATGLVNDHLVSCFRHPDAGQ